MNNITKIVIIDELPGEVEEGTLYVTKKNPCRIYFKGTEITDLFEFITSDSSPLVTADGESVVEGYSDIKDESLDYHSSLNLFHLFDSSVESFSKEVTSSQSVVVLNSKGTSLKVQGLTDQGLLPQSLLDKVVKEVESLDIRPNWEVW